MRLILENETEKIKFDSLFSQHHDNIEYLSYINHLVSYKQISKDYVKLTTESNIEPFDKKKQFVYTLLSQHLTNNPFILDNLLWDCHLLSLEEFSTNRYLRILNNIEFATNKSRLTHETIPAFCLFKSFEEYAFGDQMALKLACGFFDQKFTHPVLYLHQEKRLSLNPLEIKATEIPILVAKGKVLNLGLKLGYFAYMATLKEEVTELHIVEEDRQLIALFKQFLLPRFNHPEKIHIHHAKTLEFVRHIKDGDYDYIYIDLWQEAEEGIGLYLSLKKLLYSFNLTKHFYWLENSIITQLRLLVIDVLKDTYLQKESKYSGLKKIIHQNLSLITLTNSYELDALLSINGLRKLLLTK